MSQQLQVLKRLCFSVMALSVAGLTVISTQAAWAQDVPPATPNTGLNNGSGAGSNPDATPAQPLRTQQRSIDTIRIDGTTRPTSQSPQNSIGQQNDTLNQDSTIDQNNTTDQNGTMEQDGMMQQDDTLQQDTTIQRDQTIQQDGTTNTAPTSQPSVNEETAPTSQPYNTEDTDADATTEADQSPAAWW